MVINGLKLVGSLQETPTPIQTQPKWIAKSGPFPDEGKWVKKTDVT